MVLARTPNFSVICAGCGAVCRRLECGRTSRPRQRQFFSRVFAGSGDVAREMARTRAQDRYEMCMNVPWKHEV